MTTPLIASFPQLDQPHSGGLAAQADLLLQIQDRPLYIHDLAELAKRLDMAQMMRTMFDFLHAHQVSHVHLEDVAGVVMIEIAFGEEDTMVSPWELGEINLPEGEDQEALESELNDLSVNLTATFRYAPDLALGVTDKVMAVSDAARWTDEAMGQGFSRAVTELRQARERLVEVEAAAAVSSRPRQRP